MYCLLYICIIYIVNIYVYIYCKKRKGKRSCRELLMVVVSLAHNHSYYILHKIIIVMTGGTVVKNPAASAGDAEDWVWSLGCADPLKEEMAAHSSILAWRIPWTEDPGELQPWGRRRARHDLCTDACANDSHIYWVPFLCQELFQAGKCLLIIPVERWWTKVHLRRIPCTF